MTEQVEIYKSFSLIKELEEAGAITPVSLDLTDANLTYDRWEALGRLLGSVKRSTSWYIGDWLIFGEALFGEEHAQGVESTVSERYDIAERVTGLTRETLMNYKSVCQSIAVNRRRENLPFSIHIEVAPLTPREQRRWLAHAEKESLTRAELHRAIREAGEAPEPGEQPQWTGNGAVDLSSAGLIVEAAMRVFHQAEVLDDGTAIVPADPWSRFAALLNEE
jgi:hypothetical protein